MLHALRSIFCVSVSVCVCMYVCECACVCVCVCECVPIGLLSQKYVKSTKENNEQA